MTDPIEPEGDDADLVDAFHLTRYRKMIAALALGLIGWATQVVVSTSGPVTSGEWVSLGAVAVVTLGVYAIPNKGA